MLSEYLRHTIIALGFDQPDIALLHFTISRARDIRLILICILV
jgi:hypothetical protein